MSKLQSHFILYSIVCCLFFSCQSIDEPYELSKDRRTILVYMLADNNLSTSYKYDKANIEEMADAIAESDIKGHWVIYYAGANESPYLQEVVHTKTGASSIETVKSYPGQLSTSTDAIKEVLQDVKELYNTQEYGLIIWSHATGWLPQNRFYSPSRPAPASLGREGNEHRSIDIDSLRMALETQHFNFILFDVCLMGSVEVAYELRNTCDYIIASPTETLGAGYPYKAMIPLLFKEEINYEDVCKCYYDKYIGPGSQQTGTISLIRTAPLERLSLLCRNIVQNHQEDISRLDANDIQYYDRTTPHIFYDLGHFMESVANDTEFAELSESLGETVLYKAASPTFIGIPILQYSGLSCYISGSSHDEETEKYYSMLQWYNTVYK